MEFWVSRRIPMYCLFYVCSLALCSIPLLGKKFNAHQRTILEKHVIKDRAVTHVLDALFARDKNPNSAFKQAGCTFIKELGRTIVTHPDVPGYVLKAMNYENEQASDAFANLICSNRNINRILVNEQIRACVQKYNLQHIYVPNKYLYHIPGTPHTFEDANYIVLSEKLDLVCQHCNQHAFAFHLKEPVKQEILTIIREVGYADADLDNICYLKTGKIAFIDTEQIYACDVLEAIGFKKIIHKLAGNSGRARFLKACNRPKKQTGHRKLDTELDPYEALDDMRTHEQPLCLSAFLDIKKGS